MHSPHTSPRSSRKPLPNIPTMSSSSSSSSTSSSNRSDTPPHVPPSTSSNANSKSSKITPALPQAGPSSGSYSGNKNMVGASNDIPDIQAPLNKHLARVVDSAPPLPPRKSVANQSQGLPAKAPVTVPKEQVVANLIDVPPKSPPKSPVHHGRYHDLLTGDSLDEISEENGEPIVGPAETITGLIDTRPMDQRNLTTFASLNSNSINLITINDADKEEKPLQSQLEISKNSNTYLLNNNFQNNNHQRPHSFKNQASSQSQQQPIKSKSLEAANPPLLPPHKERERENVQLYENVTTTKSLPGSSSANSCNNSSRLAREDQDKQMMTISNNNSINLNNVNNNTASYENINLEYINRLMSEGYSKENVVKALGISGNNIEMACHILHEFADKSTIKAAPKVQIRANKGETH